MKKKIIFSVLLIFMFTAISVGSYEGAYAATTVSSAEELAEAISAAGISQEIILGDNITIDKTKVQGLPLISIGSGVNIILDLNGKQLTFTDETIFDVKAGTLTLKNGTIRIESEYAAISVTEGAWLRMENVTGTAPSSEIIYAQNSKIYLNGVTLSVSDGVTPVINLVGDENKVYGSDGQELQDIGSSITQQYVPSTSGDSKTNQSQHTIPVTATVDETFSIVFPGSINFGNLTYTDDESSKTVTVSVEITLEYFIAEDADILVISVYGDGTDGAFELKCGTSTIEYVVKDENGAVVSPNGTALTFTAAGTKTITLEIDRSKLTKSGEYTGNINFDVKFG